MAFIPLIATAASAIGSALGVGGAAAATGAAGAAAGGFSLSSALALGSTLLGAVGAVSQASAQSKAASYNAQVQEQQARVQEQQATVRATDMATRTRQRMAATRAGAVQNGFELDGSVSDILSTVETQGALEGMTALYDGSTRAQGLRSSAELNRSNASSAMTAGYLGAGTSLLSGFSKMYTG